MSSVFSGDTAFRTLNIGNNVQTIPSYAFYYCRSLTSVSIGNSVTSIGERAFYYCSKLDSVTIPNSVTSIGNYAFQSCSGLTSITIPNSVTSIGDYAFSGCSGLTFVSIGNSVTSIGYSAFRNCSGLTSVTIGNSVTNIGSYAFYDCSGLTSVTIPDSVTSIGYSAFSNCTSLQTVNYNAVNCTTIGNNSSLVFSGDAAFTTLNIGNDVQTIPNFAFQNCSGLTSVTIGNSVTSIGERAFYYCSGLTSVSIGNSVTSIGNNAFQYCSGLTTINVDVSNPRYSSNNGIVYSKLQDTLILCPEGRIGSVTIPNSVTSIGDGAFYNCSGLTSITSNAVIPPTLGSNVFYNVPKYIPVYVPCQSGNSYKFVSGWYEFINYTNFSATSDTTFYNVFACYGTFYTDNNFTIPLVQTGIYYATRQSVNGCDSVVCLNLFIYPNAAATNYAANICQGGTYTDNNFANLTQAGQYYDTLQNVNGCDSVLCLNLNYYPYNVLWGKHLSRRNLHRQ